MEQTVTIYLAKAIESLLSAESEFVNGRYNSCANRCYYACFQAAIAALLGEGTAPQASRALRRSRLFVTAIRQRGGVAQ